MEECVHRDEALLERCENENAFRQLRDPISTAHVADPDA